MKVKSRANVPASMEKCAGISAPEQRPGRRGLRRSRAEERTGEREYGQDDVLPNFEQRNGAGHRLYRAGRRRPHRCLRGRRAEQAGRGDPAYGSQRLHQHPEERHGRRHPRHQVHRHGLRRRHRRLRGRSGKAAGSHQRRFGRCLQSCRASGGERQGHCGPCRCAPETVHRSHCVRRHPHRPRGHRRPAYQPDRPRGGRRERDDRWRRCRRRQRQGRGHARRDRRVPDPAQDL